ncbi:hypothetical protein [Pseudoalteromonas sp. R3]|uniref:hypothetical protein n=1 Tax=Pseudoalteromonas sp. R3 TaxID=1709477 RepID=UPI0006B63AFC|nr:hypothetical protein [Pseudoalteromonas sp. R3]AZZ99632.1 hypothetical protein ELR70_22710 [Pseudoalteromonas sp. R3]
MGTVRKHVENWNRQLYPATFQGFVERVEQPVAAELLALSKQANFADIVWSGADACMDDVWSTMTVAQLQQMLEEGGADLPRLCYVRVEPELLASKARVADLIDTLESALTHKVFRFRLVLQEAYRIGSQELKKALRVCDLIGCDRIAFEDCLGGFRPAGVENFMLWLAPKALAYELSTEFIFYSSNIDAHDNALRAIEHGCNYLQVSAHFFNRERCALAVGSVLESYGDYQRFFDLALLEKYICLRLFGGDEAFVEQEALQVTPAPIAGTAKVQVTPTIRNDAPVSLRFEVSDNDWHVRLLLKRDSQSVDLGERVHHYILLLLVREYHEQAMKAWEAGEKVDPLLTGWVERELLHRMIGDNETQFNVKLCRAKKQLNDAAKALGLDVFEPCAYRQGALRINFSHVEVLKGNSCEIAIENWQIAEPEPDEQAMAA